MCLKTILIALKIIVGKKVRKDVKMIFSLRDNKAEVFGPLFEARTEDEAKRMLISALLSGGESNLSRYPQDHSLYLLGDFDNVNGILDVIPQNMILTGLEACQLCKQYKDNMSLLFGDVTKTEDENVNSIDNSSDT